MRRPRYFSLLVLSSALLTLATAQSVSPKVKQPREVEEAYRVCNRYQQLLAENLDFDRAFEATFTTNRARRREIAITEGEFGDVDLARVDDASLISAFKSRMQILYLMLPLVSPNDRGEEELFFPPPIRTIFQRKGPQAPEEFPAFALQLKRDAADLRAHLDQLAQQYPAVAKRVSDFKTDLSKKIESSNHVVKPLTAYSRGRVLGLHDEYYQIDSYSVIKERGQMKIIGIRFFTRLF